MDETQVIHMLIYLNIILLGLVTIGACLYSIPLCFVRRFHKPNHLLTVNVCIATFIFSIFWIIFFVMDTYYPYIFWSVKSCLLIAYLQSTVNCQVLYSLCVVSLNRLFTIIYKNKALFQSNKWAAICISGQWIVSTLISLPVFTSNSEVI